MWNLLQIVREMLLRHDINGVQLLDILTRQCLAQEQVIERDREKRVASFDVYLFAQIIQWWFTTKVSNVYNERGTTGLKPHNASLVQQASSALCDEIVQIWRLIALNPSLTHEERHTVYVRLCTWHLSIIERICRQKTTTTNISTTTNGVYTSPTTHPNNDRTMNQKRRDIDIFPGFLPAIETCQINWSKCPYYPKILEQQSPETRPWAEYIRYYDVILTDGYAKLNNTNYHTAYQVNSQQQQIVLPSITDVNEQINLASEEKCHDVDSGEESSGGANVDQHSSSNSGDECQIYFAGPPSPTHPTRATTTTAAVVVVSTDAYVLKTLKTISDPLQVSSVAPPCSIDWKIF